MNHVTPEEVLHSQRGPKGVFFVERDGRRVAELTYAISGGEAIVDHTYVDPALRGGTLASSLVEAAVRWARRENLRILPLCPYVSRVFDRTPAYADVRA
jgi:predicted GNAT family acetyltransferase